MISIIENRYWRNIRAIIKSISDLYCDIVLGRSMDGSIETKTNNKDSPVHDKSDFIWGATVTPSALNLLEPAHSLLLARHGTSGNIQESHRRLGVDSEMQEKGDSLPISEDSGLGRALGELLHRHEGEPDLVEGAPQHRPLVLYRYRKSLPLTLSLGPPGY